MNQDLAFLQQEVEQYSRDSAEVDRVMADHHEARRCVRFEHNLKKGLFLFRSLVRTDEILREQAFAGRFDYTDEVREAFAEAFRWWLEPRERVLARIAYFEELGYDVEGASEFRSAAEEAVGMVTADSEFFAGEELATLRDRAIDANRAGECEDMAG